MASAPAPGAAPAANSPGVAPPSPPPETEPIRQIKPIPPGASPTAKSAAKPGEEPAAKSKPRLPGVHGKDDFDAEDLSLPRRDPKTGQFLTRAEREAKFVKEAFGKDEAEPGEATPEKPALPPGAQEPAKKIKFNGRDYDNLAAIEQEHKSLQGQFRNLNETIRTRTDERDYGYKAAAAWMTAAPEAFPADSPVRQRIAALEAQLGGGPAAAQPAAAGPASELPSVEDILGDIDTDAFETFATQPGGLKNAAAYLASEILTAVATKFLPVIEARIEQTSAPFHMDRQEQLAHATANQVVGSVRELKDPRTGQSAFPELDSPTTQAEIGNLARELGMTEQQLLTPQGVMQAVAAYRLFQSYLGAPEASLSTTPAADMAVPVGAPGAAALLDAEPGSGLPPNDGRAANLPAATKRLLKALDHTSMRDPTLGFAKNVPQR